MRTETVTLAGQEYTLKELPSRKNAEWRRKLQVAFDKAEDLIAASQRDLSSVADLMSVVRDAKMMILEAPDTVTELLFAYSSELAADKERIQNEGYESEFFEAFIAVLRLAFPFSRLLDLVQAISVSGSAPKR